MDYNLTPIRLNLYTLARILQSRGLFYFALGFLVLRVFILLLSINIPQNIFFADITRSALQSFINHERQINKLGLLQENEKLSRAAELKAANMINNNYFSHISPTGIAPWHWFSVAGYNYNYAGENLAVGFYESEEVFQAWLNSPAHRANVLNPHFQEIGTAVVRGFGTNNAIIVVQLFGSQKIQPTPSSPNSLNINNIQASVEVPAPKTKPAEQPPAENLNQASAINLERGNVLSESIPSTETLEVSKVSGTGYHYKFMNAILYNYDGLFQNIVFGSALLVIGILITLIFANFSFTGNLAFRAFMVIVFLIVATAIDRQALVSLIPHQVII